MDDDFNDLLKQADEFKISDSEKFNVLIQRLEKESLYLSSVQKEKLQYLSVFKVIRGGNYNLGIAELENIFSQSNVMEVKIRSRLTLSNLYAFTGAYEQAFQSLKFVTEQIDEVNDSDLKVVVYLAMANTYLLTNQYDMSMRFSKLLLEGDIDEIKQCRAQTYFSVAKIKNSSDDIDNEEINDIINNCLKLGQAPLAKMHKILWINKKLNKVGSHNKIKTLQQFITDLNADEILEDTVILKSLELMESSLKANIYWKMGDAIKAEIYAQKVLLSPKSMGDNEPRISALNVLKSLAHERKDLVQAYSYLSQLADIEATFKRDNQLKRMAFLNVEHANLAQALEIEQLNKANNILKIEQNLAEQKALNQKLIVALLMVLLALLVYILYRMKIRHDELESISVMDHLTKVLNRKGFEVQLNEMLLGPNPNNQELHLAILDLDYFKRVNDEHGHLTGDWILKHVIYEVKKHMDSRMVLGRLGGEEFGILGNDMSSKEMDSKIEKIRMSIEQLDCNDSGHDIKITASFGVTSNELSGHTMQMMLAHADLALYQAKSNGRNQWVRYHYLN